MIPKIHSIPLHQTSNLPCLWKTNFCGWWTLLCVKVANRAVGFPENNGYTNIYIEVKYVFLFTEFPLFCGRRVCVCVCLRFDGVGLDLYGRGRKMRQSSVAIDATLRFDNRRSHQILVCLQKHHPNALVKRSSSPRGIDSGGSCRTHFWHTLRVYDKTAIIVARLLYRAIINNRAFTMVSLLRCRQINADFVVWYELMRWCSPDRSRSSARGCESLYTCM